MATSKRSCALWEVENKKKLQTISPLQKPAGSSFRGCTFVGNDSEKFITVQGKPRFKSLITEWNSLTGSLVRSYKPSLSGPQTALGSSTQKKQVIAVAFGEGDIEMYDVSPAGKIAATCRQKGVHTFIVTSVAVTKDLQLVASGSADRTFAVTRIRGGSSLLQYLCLFLLLDLFIILVVLLWIFGLGPAIDLVNSV